LYFFIRDLLLGGATPSKDAMFRAFAAGKGMANGSWAVNAAGYWAERHRPNVLILFYASMKRDLEGTVRRIAAFLDIQVPDEVIREVCRRSSFEYMKSIDSRFVPYNGAPWREGGRMMRKGRQGGASELLSAEQQAEIDANFQAELARLGSDLPYDQVCGID
jgi:aryl sulfotransferase